MEIREVLDVTAEMYARLRVASIRRGDEDEDLSYRGLFPGVPSEDKPQRPCGLVLVTTREPVGYIQVVAGEDPAPAQIAGDALEELAGIVGMHGGRAGILWLNAGQPAMLSGASLVNAARAYQLSLDREEAGNSWPASSRQLPWASFKPIPLSKVRDQVVIDWLAGCVTVKVTEPAEEPGQA